MGRILIIDDHPDTCEVLRLFLSVAGHDAVCVSDPAEAVPTASAYRPGLIVLDYMMPKMNGFEVLLQLKADPRLAPVPILMYSAAPDPALRDEAMRLGATGWVSKGAMDWGAMMRAIDRAYPNARGGDGGAPSSDH